MRRGKHVHIQRGKSLRGRGFALAAVLLVLTLGIPVGYANPEGIPDGAKLVYNWNLIGTPGDYEGGCGQGHRIFVQRDANHEHILIQDHDDGWHVAECDATFGDQAVLHSDDLGTFNVYARILGKPGGHLEVCADVVSDHEGHLCLLGTIDLTRGSGKENFGFQPDALFDAELEDIIWSVETNSDFRIVQFRVYLVP